MLLLHAWPSAIVVDRAVVEEESRTGGDRIARPVRPGYASATLARIHPVDRSLIYVASMDDPDTGRYVRTLLRFVHGTDATTEDDIREPTGDCVERGGVSTFYYDPLTDELIANCHSAGNACKVRVLASSFRNWDQEPCYEAPFYGADGNIAYDFPIAAINADGLQLHATRNAFGLRLYDPVADEHIDLTYEPIDDDPLTLAIRGHESGFHVALGSQESTGRRLYFIAPDGTVELEGRYADATGIPWNYALDSEGRLYDDVGTEIRRFAPDGTAPRTVHDDELLHGGLSALLITGPY